MNATARKTRSVADVESPSDELDLSDLLDAGAPMTDTDTPINDNRTRDSDARSLRGGGRQRPDRDPHRTTLDLIA
jgi:hypothetical protein